MDHTLHTNDSIFKSLETDHPQDFLSFVLPGAVYIRQLPTELVRDPVRADALILAYVSAAAEQEIGVHLEEQTTESLSE